MSTNSIPALHASRDEQYQRDLRLALRSGWWAYVFPHSWMFTVLPSWLLGALLVGLIRQGMHASAIWHDLLNSGFLTWGIGFLLGFQLLFRSIDRVGKREVARTMGLLP